MVHEVGYTDACQRNKAAALTIEENGDQSCCRVPRSLDLKSDGKVANSSYAENVLGPAMAGGWL